MQEDHPLSNGHNNASPVESVQAAAAFAGFVVPGMELQRRHVHQWGLDQGEDHGQAHKGSRQDELWTQQHIKSALQMLSNELPSHTCLIILLTDLSNHYLSSVKERI